jgi:hypothetical protein
LASRDIDIQAPANSTLILEPAAALVPLNMVFVAGAKLVAPTVAVPSQVPVAISAGSVTVKGASGTGGGIICSTCGGNTRFQIDTNNTGGSNCPCGV